MSTPWNQPTQQPDDPHSLAWYELHFARPSDIGAARSVLEQLSANGSLGSFVIEVRMNAKRVRWLLGAPRAKLPRFKPVIEAALPVRTVEARPRRRLVDRCRHLRIRGQALSTDAKRAEEVTRQLYALAASLSDGEQLVIQLLLGSRLLPPIHPRGDGHHWLVQLAGALIAPPATPKALSANRELADLHGARGHLRVGVVTDHGPKRQTQLLASVLGTLRTLEGAGTRLTYRPSLRRHLDHVQLPWRWSLRLRSIDIPALTGWPIGQPPLPLLDGLHPRLLSPPNHVLQGPRSIGVSNGPGEKKPVVLPWIDALFHTHILGPTGSGKSTVLLNLILADIRQGLGTLVIDPKGDLVADVLARIPAQRHDDVVIIDPTSDRPIGFNPLACHPDDAHVAADSLLATMAALFKENWGIRTEDALSNALLTLARHPEANLMWLVPLLTDPVFRKRVLSEVPADPLGTDNYWHRFDNLKDSAQALEIAPVLNKLRQITIRPGLRSIFGQTNPRFSFDELLVGNKIVLISLNKGRIGSQSARLLGSLVISHLWTKILARQGLPPRARKIRTVYIDEVHDFLAGIPGDLADALAQARSLGVAFILANQYRGQLSPDMQQAIDANTRTKIVFGLSGADAKDVARATDELEPKDFLLLPKYTAYVNLMQDAQNTGWFSIATAGPPPESSDPADVYFRSHLTYGVPALDTELALAGLTRHLAKDTAQRTHFARTTNAAADTEAQNEADPDPAQPPPQTAKRSSTATTRGGRTRRPQPPEASHE